MEFLMRCLSQDNGRLMVLNKNRPFENQCYWFTAKTRCQRNLRRTQGDNCVKAKKKQKGEEVSCLVVFMSIRTSG